MVGYEGMTGLSIVLGGDIHAEPAPALPPVSGPQVDYGRGRNPDPIPPLLINTSGNFVKNQ